ncbi:hypothetical protein DFH27DRAFT_256065 [Peziza echinospora]|nr:hypothetical protein DFH27DRAFT_256065 [Peziza echinospora]
MSAAQAQVSHGRGGTGNIGPDDGEYVDGGIHRAGDPAASGAAYSTGRGGASNIASPKASPAVGAAADDDIIPDVAKVITNDDQPHHAGRGGQGNVVAPGKKPHKGLADRIKDKLFQILKGKRSAKAAAADTTTPAAATKTETTTPEVAPAVAVTEPAK